MISGWSHVIHAIYKPWGAASPTYKIQHLSLFTTTFVFVMGLLLKVNGVVQQSPGFQVMFRYSQPKCSCPAMCSWAFLWGVREALHTLLLTPCS